MKRILATTTALLGVMVAQSAWAASTTATMAVSAGVNVACTVSATRLAFHSIANNFAGTGAATVSVDCTNGADYDIGLDYGLHASGSQRNLQGQSNPGLLVSYGVFKDTGYSIPWGNIPGVDTAAGTGNGSVQTFPVYAQVPSQSVATDVYTDTITVTLTY